MSRIRCFAGLAAVAVLVGAASLAQAQNWSVPSGNWSNPNNWSPAGVPNNESAAITNGGTCTIADSDGVVGGPSVSSAPVRST